MYGNYVSVLVIGVDSDVIGGGDGCESSAGSSSSNSASFSFDGFPLRSFERLFWNQTCQIQNFSFYV